MSAHDDFFELLQRLGDCYVNDLQHSSCSLESFRKELREEGQAVGRWAWSSVKPPSESKTLPKPGQGPELLPISDWIRQISSGSPTPAALRLKIKEEEQ